MTIIVGIDPGSRITGYGVIDVQAQTPRFITCGIVRATGEQTADKLNSIHSGLTEVIRHSGAQESAIEEVFFDKNHPASALKLGQARGVAMLALAQAHLPVAEYAPRKIKQSVVGYGAADKAQVGQMVKHLLCLSDLPQVDAADALAIALCHAFTRNTMRLIARAMEGD